MQLNKQTWFVILVSVLLFNCSEKDLNSNLQNGLKNYRKIRNINENLIEGYAVKKLAFFKKDSIHYQFVLLLNNEAVKDTIENYSLGMVVYADKRYLPANDEYLIWGMHPTMEKHGEFKYIVKDVETPIKHIDSLHIFLYDRNGYKGVESRMIRLKNIEL